MRRFIIDTDTAADDAAAIVYMLRNEDVSVEAITVVMGNVPLEQATSNALCAVEAADTYAPPVYVGIARPLLREPYTATNVHGADGLGDSGIKPQRLSPSREHAIDKICEIIMKNPHEIELLTLGPLTNIALAYLKYPQIASLVKNVVVMGGSGFERGNVTEYAEFNLYADAEAAKIVFSSGMPITAVGCELSDDECGITADEAELLKSSPDPAAGFIYAVTRRLREFDLETYGRDEIFLPDAVAAAVAVEPSVSSRLEAVNAHIEVAGERYGQLALSREGEPNILLAHKLDSAAFKKMLFDSIARADS